MGEDNKLIKVYTGTEASALVLMARLGETGISPLIKNDFSDSWLLTAPSIVTMYIRKSDFKEAEPIVREFISNNKS